MKMNNFNECLEKLHAKPLQVWDKLAAVFLYKPKEDRTIYCFSEDFNKKVESTEVNVGCAVVKHIDNGGVSVVCDLYSKTNGWSGHSTFAMTWEHMEELFKKGLVWKVK